MRFLVAIVILLCLYDNIAGQDYPSKDISIDDLASLLPQVPDINQTYPHILENLTQLLSDPIDLNRISPEQFQAFFVISSIQISSFYDYLKDNGPLLSVYELQAVPNWDREAFDRIIPFVKVVDPAQKINAAIFNRISKEKNNYLILRTEKTIERLQGSRSTTPTAKKFEGDPYKFYLRYKVARSNDFSIGFTAEKDAGESFRWSANQKKYGIDYLSFHAQLLNKGKIKNIIVGDFQSQFGQGLVLGTAFGFGKNSETIATVKRNNLGFLPYTSVNEVNFFRGLAFSFQLTPKLTLHSFGSRINKDGRLANTITRNAENEVTSIIETGLHRTKSEIANRKQILETNLGVVLHLKKLAWDAGIIYHHTSFNKLLQPTPSIYNKFYFRGNKNQNVGAFINYRISNFVFFGEIGKTINHGMGIVLGTIGSLTNKMDIALHYRSFEKNFYSFTSNAFSESTSPQNERGFYWGLKYTVNRRISVNGYIDFFSFPWIRYQSYAPSKGFEWLLQLNYSLSKKIKFFLQVREENKVRNSSKPSVNTYLTTNGTKRTYTLNGNYEVSPFLNLKTRIQACTYNIYGSYTNGIVAFQELKFSIKRIMLSLGYALFDTDNFDNRIYLYERDVWLAHSFYSFNGLGNRHYFLAKYNLSKKISLWLKWSQIKYNNQDKIGTNENTIDGNSKNDVKFQVRIKF